MMRSVRLYDNPEHFAEMMMRQLSESLNVVVRQREGEPLLLDVELNPDDPNETAQISLHNTYRTYRVGGDLNAAVDYLNNIVRTSNYLRSKKGDVRKLDSAYIFPAIRDERYVDEAGIDSPFLSEAYLPGLRVIFLEIKDGCSKIVNRSVLESNPRLTEEKVRRLAYRNLRAAGWQPSRLSLESPFRKSCIVEVFLDNPHPIECQFLLPELSISHMPDNCVIAYTNRKCTMLMHSRERMETMAQARRLVDRSRFREVVKRSYYLMPSPVSLQLYWINNGKAELLEDGA